jgi:hypothetical protein
MLARLKGAFQRALTEADLLRVIEHRLMTPPMPQEWLDVLATIRAKSDGGSLTELWRDRFRADVKSIAGEPTWALQRARLLRRIAEAYGWTAFNAAMREATHQEAWLDTFKKAFPEAAAASPETSKSLITQHVIMAACTEACLEELGQAIYSVDKIKLMELQVLEAARRENQVLQTRLHDRILDAPTDDPELRDALIEWHDAHCVPLLNEEWRSLHAMEEAVVSGSFDSATSERQSAEFQRKLVAVLQEMPVRLGDVDP